MATITMRVEVRLKSHPAQRATFLRFTDAKAWARDTESDIKHGRHFKTARAKRHTLADLVDRYTRDVLPTKRVDDGLRKASPSDRQSNFDKTCSGTANDAAGLYQSPACGCARRHKTDTVLPTGQRNLQTFREQLASLIKP